MKLALQEDSMKATQQKKYDDMERVLLGKIDNLEQEKSALESEKGVREVEESARDAELSRLQNATNELKGSTKRLRGELEGVRRQVSERDESIASLRADLDTAETSRLRLLERFMSEMDRMRGLVRDMNMKRKRT